MTKAQSHIVTMLMIKYGGFEALVDMWLYSDDTLTENEMTAVEKFLEDDQQPKPFDINLQENDEYPFLTADFSINSLEKD